MPKPRREGYLMIDHRFSPGITPEQAHATGLAAPAVGADRFWESATVTCCHCNTVVILNPNRTRPRNYCARCDQYVCDSPACGLECRPFDKLLDVLQEAAGRHTHLFIDGKCHDCGSVETPGPALVLPDRVSVSVPLTIGDL